MRFSHAAITVRKMDESLDFYTGMIGLEASGRREIPENRTEIAFVTDTETGMRIELTHWKDKGDCSEGDQLDHLGFEVGDIKAAVDRMRSAGVRIMKEPCFISGSNRPIAFVSDPNGIWIELLERRPVR